MKVLNLLYKAMLKLIRRTRVHQFCSKPNPTNAGDPAAKESDVEGGFKKMAE